MAATILLVEDELAIRDMTNFALSQAGFTIMEAENAAQAVTVIADQRPDLILLDWMLPDTSGIELARRFKRDELTRDIPIIMLTARGEEEEKLRGFEAGADDYITKPFSPKELVARIKAVLRRGGTLADESLEINGLQLDNEGHRILAKGHNVDLGPTEYRLLSFFMTHPDRVYSRSQLLDRVWGSNVYVEERTVDVHIRRLRKALSTHEFDQYIQTVRGAGYRFSARS